MNNPLRIVFMGTPDFAAGVLQAMLNNRYKVVGVVTVPDKPAGRGQQLQSSAVKCMAEANQIPVLQPEKLRDENFLTPLRAWNADVFVVVAFRMLPEVVWAMPKHGTFNLHASLLPQYRGAAPINWAIINGEKETGVTTFFINHDIDTGNIIFSEKTTIGENENAGELHDRLMEIGACLVLRTLDSIAGGTIQAQPQRHDGNLKSAPKIFKEICKINWNSSAQELHDLVRGLSPYPAAFAGLQKEDGSCLTMKILAAQPEMVTHHYPAGAILCNQKDMLKVACGNGFLIIHELQVSGKKRMNTVDFLRGCRDMERYRFV